MSIAGFGTRLSFSGTSLSREGSRLSLSTTNLTLVTGGTVSAYYDGTNAYIRAPYWLNSDLDVIRLVDINEPVTTIASSCVDFKGLRLVDATTEDIITAWNAGEVFTNSIDNGPPTRYNNQFLGAGHGLAAAWVITSVGHGMTNADVGDVGTVSAVSWVLVRVDSADTFTVVAANTGATVNRWAIVGTPPTSGTLVFSGAGSKVYTSRTSTQIFPLVRNHVRQLKLNGTTAISSVGNYRANFIVVEESYDIPNPAEWLLLLIAQKGTSSPIPLNDPTVPLQTTIYNQWRFDKYGAMTGRNRVVSSTEVAMGTTGTFNYWGAWQYQRISGADVYQYIPDLSGPVGGYDFINIANVTSNSSTVNVGKSSSIDTANPPSHFAQLTKDGTADFVRGFAMGYHRLEGQGVPATRALNTWLWQLSTSEKQYPVAVDGTRFAASRMPAGTDLVTVFWEFPYKTTDNPTYTVNAAYERDEKIFRVFDVHASLTNQDIAMPAGTAGLPITIISTGGTITVNSTEVAVDDTINISTTTWGRAIIQVG